MSPRRISFGVALGALGVSALVLGDLTWRAQGEPAARAPELGLQAGVAPPFHAGEPLPDLVLLDHAGRALRLRALRGRPAWLAFIRGAYCAYCREQLRELGARARDVAQAGVQLLAVTPDPPAIAARLRDELALSFPLLSDPGEQAVTTLCGGLAHCQLLVDAEGIVRWAGSSENWSESPAPEALLAAARRLAR